MALRLKLSKLFSPLAFARANYSCSVDKGHMKIVTTDDESTFVAWHPKQDFPYECTLPLPEKLVAEEDTALKIQFSPDVYEALNRKHPDLARLELMRITHTTKHRWFPRSRDKKFKKPPQDREYL